MKSSGALQSPRESLRHVNAIHKNSGGEEVRSPVASAPSTQLAMSAEMRLTFNLRNELQLSADEVALIQDLLLDILKCVQLRASQRILAQNNDAFVDEFLLPADEPFYRDCKERLKGAIQLTIGETRAKRFMAVIEKDTRFAAWGKNETVFRFYDPTLRGGVGAIRAEIIERNPKTRDVVSRADGAFDYVKNRYGVLFEEDSPR